MANTKQAKKRVIQAEKRRKHNFSQRTRLRTYIKKVRSAISSGDSGAALSSYQEAVSVIDRIAAKGIIHKNKAARHKSRLIGHIKKMTPQETAAQKI